MDEMKLRELVALYERFPSEGGLRVHTDTTEFMDLRSGEVLKLQGNYYLIRGEETEKRFGLEDEPKYWVKRAIDLSDGTAKIVKLVHRETFTYHVNGQYIRCFSSAMKEARVLYKMKGDPSFMQGFTTLDDSGNLVRVVDRIQGESFYEHIKSMEMGHEEYFYNCFPAIFRKILFSIKAIGRLHRQGERHGDIRADHVLIERKTGNYNWIDFNYDYEWPERPCGLDLFGLRNILLCAAGKGFHTAFDNHFSGLDESDFSLLFHGRITNLKKLFPYIPDDLNRILRSFSHGNDLFYNTTEELMADLCQCGAIFQGSSNNDEALESAGRDKKSLSLEDYVRPGSYRLESDAAFSQWELPLNPFIMCCGLPLLPGTTK